MEHTKYVGISFVSLLIVSLLTVGVGSIQAQEELPRDETVIIGGDMSYTGISFNPINYPWIDKPSNITYMRLSWFNFYTGKLEPWLAESWEWSADGGAFIVNIQPEARWRDGTPVTAEDVVFSLESSAEYGAFITLDPEAIESVEAVDEHTVRFNIVTGKELYPQITGYLINPIIYPKARWSALIDEKGEEITEYLNFDWDEINGSGPYTPIFESKEKIIFERVDDWWGNEIYGQPKPKYVLVLGFETGDLLVRETKEGDLDWGVGYATGIYTWVMTHKDTVEVWDIDNPEGKIFCGVTPIYMTPNLGSTEHPELAEPWVRKAVAYALDMDHILYVTQGGLVKRQTPTLIVDHGGWADEYADYDLVEDEYGAKYIPYDPAKAIEILEEHCTGSVEEGWTWNGEEIGGWTIDTVAGWVDVNLATEMVCDYLADIGIDAVPNMIDVSIRIDRTLGMNFDWTFYNLGSPSVGLLHPINELDILLTGPAGQWRNWCDYSQSPNYDRVKELIDEAYFMPIGSAESIANIEEVQSYVIPELPYIPLYTSISVTICRTTHWIGWPSVDNPYQGINASYSPDVTDSVLLHLEPARVGPVFEVSDLGVSPDVVAPGDSVTISVAVKNAGDTSGTYTVELKIDGTTEDTSSVTLAAGAFDMVSFTVTKDVEKTYEVSVDGLTGSLDVTTEAPPPTEIPIMTWAAIAVAIVALIVAIGVPSARWVAIGVVILALIAAMVTLIVV